MNQEARPADDELVALAKAGRREGFEGLYMRHARRVYNLARRLLADDAAAEDVVQDVFLQTFRSIQQFRGAAEFSTWLHRVAYNACVNRIRAASVRRAASIDSIDASVGPTSDAPDAEALLKREDLQRQIDLALSRLDVDHRAVLVMRVIEERSYGEIATSLDMTEDQVRGKLYRARKAFLRHFRP